MDSPATQCLAIHTHRCLNNRGAEGFCRICANNCPGHAITIANDDICVDATRCSECALCVIDCPTEVFTHAGFVPLDFINLAKGATEVHLRCQFGDAAEAGSSTLPIPCHGVLDDRLLAGLSAIGVKYLYLYGLSQCARCPTAVGALRLAKTLQRSAPSPAASFPAITDASESGETILEGSGTDSFDRRDFLDASVSAIAYAAISALPETLLTAQDSETGNFVPGQHDCSVKHIPQRHRLALSALENGAVSFNDCTDEQTWFHEIRAVGGCDACKLCVLVCPTGALHAENTVSAHKLNHYPASCIGCGLCTISCPQRALQLQPVHDARVIRNDCHMTLFEHERTPCSLCGTYFTAVVGHQGLCRKCESEQDIREQWLTP